MDMLSGASVCGMDTHKWILQLFIEQPLMALFLFKNAAHSNVQSIMDTPMPSVSRLLAPACTRKSRENEQTFLPAVQVR